MEYVLSDLRKLPLKERLEVIESVLAKTAQEKHGDDFSATTFDKINTELLVLAKRRLAPPSYLAE